MSSVLHCGWLWALARVEGKAVDVVDSADVADTVVIADAVSDLSSQSSHLSLLSLLDSPSPPKSHHELPSVPFPPEAHTTSPLHATSHHLRISHPSYSVYHITARALAYSEQIPVPGKALSYILTPALTPSLCVNSDLHVPITPLSSMGVQVTYCTGLGVQSTFQRLQKTSSFALENHQHPIFAPHNWRFSADHLMTSLNASSSQRTNASWRVKLVLYLLRLFCSHPRSCHPYHCHQGDCRCHHPVF